MGGFISKLLGLGVKEVSDGVTSIIGKFVTDPAEKLKAEIELARIEVAFQQALLQADTEYAKAQAEVIMSESKSEHWLAACWRPILMLTFTFIVAFNFIIAPMFSLTVLPLPDHMWELLKLGVGGYVIGRSAEKIVPAVVEAVKK